MPTTVTDQAFGSNFDPGAPPTLPANVTVITITILDQNDDGAITSGSGDQVNGSDVIAVFNGDTVTIDGVTIVGATIYTADGGRYFTPTDGTVLLPGTVTDVGFVTDNTQLTLGDLSPPCFTRGTLIQTPEGDIPVENLEVGDLVTTFDNGPQPVRWIGSRKVPAKGIFAPIRIKAGTFDNARDLLVSQQHRILITSWKAEFYFNEREVLVPAKHLTMFDTVFVDESVGEVEYFHILFGQHEILFSEDMATESFHPGQVGISSLSPFARAELLALFPEFSELDALEQIPAARLSLRRYEAALLN